MFLTFLRLFATPTLDIGALAQGARVGNGFDRYFFGRKQPLFN